MGLDDNVIAAQRKGEGSAAWYLYNKDVRESTSSMINSAGELSKAYEYDEFGETTVKAGESFWNEIGYTGQIYDDSTGLYYYKARFYDPEDGRFVSQDTYRGEQEEPDTLHLYAYCANNPVNFVDPSGHKRKKVRIYLGVHHVSAGNYHASVLVFVSHGNKYYKNKKFKNTTKNRDYGATSKYVAKYVTFGAGPGSQGKQSGRLIAALNRKKDRNLDNKAVMKRISLTNSNDKVKKLLKLNDDYISSPTKPKYKLFPSKANNGYNSNSFAHGILSYAGFSVTKPNKKLPGWGRPVPKAYFGL